MLTPVRLLFLASVLLVGTSTPAVAVGNLDQSAESPNELHGFQWSEYSAFYGGLSQSFTVGMGGQLDGVELYLGRPDWTTYDLAVEIHESTPTGTLLATSEPVPPDAVPLEGQPGWVSFTFSEPPLVAPGDELVITAPLGPQGWQGHDPLWWWAWSGEAYDGGVAWGGYWAGPGIPSWGSWYDGSDLAFRTYVTPTAGPSNPKLAVFEAQWYTTEATPPVRVIVSDGIVHQRGVTVTLDVVGDLSGSILVDININPPNFAGTFVLTTTERVYEGAIRGDFRVGPGNSGTLNGRAQDGALIFGEFAETATGSGIYTFNGTVLTP